MSSNSAHDTYVDARAFERDYALSARTFFLWIREGKLTAYKPSARKTLVKRAEIERLLEASRQPCELSRIVEETLHDLGVAK